MKIFNSHTHTCHSHDGKGTVNDICRKALEENIMGFAVTDHCDCEYYYDSAIPEKLTQSFIEAKACQHKYKDKLIVSCGVEIGDAVFAPDFAKKIINLHKWDVVLGSVHAVRMSKLDMPFSTIDFSTLSDELIYRYIEQYFSDMLEMLETQDFDVLSHLTVVLRYIVYKYKRQVDIKKYYPVITEILKKTIALNKCLEINTSGYAEGYLMPDTDILKMYKKLGGKSIAVGSDSHTPDMLCAGLNESVAIIKKLGFDTLTYFIDRKPVKYKISAEQ